MATKAMLVQQQQTPNSTGRKTNTGATADTQQHNAAVYAVFDTHSPAMTTMQAATAKTTAVAGTADVTNCTAPTSCAGTPMPAALPVMPNLTTVAVRCHVA